MSRRTRLERPAVVRAPRTTVAAVMEKLRREIKRRLIADGLITDPRTAPPKYEFHWAVGSRGGITQANTKGEARAFIKAELGVKELPKDIQIIRVTPDADQRNRLTACEISPTQG